jgi:hypothetical protein
LLIALMPLLYVNRPEPSLERRVQASQTTDASADAATERLKAMRSLAQSIKVSPIVDDKAGPPVALKPEPLLRYNDPPRGIHDATLWAWGERGRPRAVLKVEHYPGHIAARRWVFGIVSLAPERVSIEFDDGKHWESRRTGLEPHKIEGAPTPAGSGALRLGQMKDLVRRFSASENAGPARGRLQLRVMPKPVVRYSDPDSGLIDGAVFALAYGTNPDVLLLIEARGQGRSAVAWHYDLGRLGGAETVVTLDGKEIWRHPFADPPSERETYMNRWLAARDKAP